jgi:ABC-2 type transport system ATP-binding protein
LVSDRIAFLHEGRLLRYGRLDELLGSTEEVEVALHNFVPGSDFTGQWGVASPSGAWRIASSETRHFLEGAWAQGAELVSVTPVRGDLTELFLEWSSSKGQWTSGAG